MNEDGKERLAELLLERLPDLPGPAFARGWAGLYPRSFDGRPYVGPVDPAEPRLVSAAGAGGYGIQLGPVIGQLAADWVLDGAPTSIPEAARLAPTPKRTPRPSDNHEFAAARRKPEAWRVRPCDSPCRHPEPPTEPRDPASGKPAGILAGLRVIDLSRMLSGPYATMMLADHGAEVIKVEPPEGDTSRTNGPWREGDEQREWAGYFVSLNRGKKSVVLDLKTEAGRSALRRLVKTADVLVENYRRA